MRVAQTAGLVDQLAKAFKPLLIKLFKGIDPNGKAIGYIVLNITANLLGLGNASTPFGIAAMRELEKEAAEPAVANAASPPDLTKASDNMVIFVVLNTASLQIIPTTTAALRLKNGSAAPMEILPVVWICSLSAVIMAILTAKILSKTRRGRRPRRPAKELT